jgi:hypothetical protein
MRPAKYFVVCHACRLVHRCPDGTNELFEFLDRHEGHKTGIYDCGEPAPIDRGYSGNANVKEAFGSATAFTKTNANLTNSATAGWQSNAIDNSSNLYIDALCTWELAAVNTGPANAKNVFCYAFAIIDTGGSAYTSTGDGTAGGSEGTLTYPDYSTQSIVCPSLGNIPYPIQNKAINGGPFSVAACFGGRLPPKWAVGMVNHTGMTLSVTNIKYIELYYTVA